MAIEIYYTSVTSLVFSPVINDIWEPIIPPRLYERTQDTAADVDLADIFLLQMLRGCAY